MRASITGDMTLSLLDETGFKVLGVEMLSAGTMRAGTDGALLARALNDLTLLADMASDSEPDTAPRRADEMSQFSPLPWKCNVARSEKKVALVDRNDKRIADRRFPRTMTPHRFDEVAAMLEAAIARVNLLSEIVMVGAYGARPAGDHG